MWFWGDGDTSFTANPSHTYANPGYYDICHALNSTTNACNPSGNWWCRRVAVGISCQASFSYSINNLTVNFLDSSISNSPNLSYFWDFGNGQTDTLQNPSITYNSSGTYVVCLTVSDSLASCYSQICDTITVGNQPNCVANFSYLSNQNTVNFTNLSSSGSYLWDFGDGQTDTSLNPVHTYSNSGSYVVNLTVSQQNGNSCNFLDTVYVNFCNAYFTINNNSATGIANFFNYSSASRHTLYSWNFGDGSPIQNTSGRQSVSHQYFAAGTFNVTLSLYDSTSGCTSTYSDTLMASIPPCQAGFSYTQNLDSVYFNNQASSYQLLSYDFGDGNSSFTENPIHVYAQSGSYVVCQTVGDSLGNCQNTFCDTLQVIVPQCSAAFTLSQNIDTVKIINQAVDYTHLNYAFGDGSTSTLENPQHVFGQSGTYVICQTVFDSLRNCQSTFCDTVVVNVPQCQADFTTSQNIDTIQITNLAVNYTQLSYDFGDGSSSNQENPKHVYTQSGTYVICQTVIDSNRNCQSTSCDTVVVNIPQCQADFSFSVSGDTLQLFNQASNYDHINYDFGDGSSSTMIDPQHIYSQSGTYVVCQSVIDTIRNCQNTYCDTIDIAVPQCTAGFTYQVVGDSILFQSTAQNYTSINYDFGDGSSSSLTNPYHAYAQSNFYVVQQTVMDSNRNCTDTYVDTVAVTISTSCLATFQPALDTTKPGTLYLVNNSSDLNTHHYFWDFGDGTTDTGRTSSHSYANFGAYPICLTVSDASLGCLSTFCDTLGLDSNGNVTNKSGGFVLRILDGSFIGLTEEENRLEKITLFPNPTSREIQLKLPSHLSEAIEYQIIGASGKMMRNGMFSENQKAIQLSDLSNGVYFLRLIYKNESVVKKFIKQ